MIDALLSVPSSSITTPVWTTSTPDLIPTLHTFATQPQLNPSNSKHCTLSISPSALNPRHLHPSTQAGMSEGGKISISIGGGSKPAAAPAPPKPMSNLELLMAQAKSKPASKASAAKGKPASSSKPLAFGDEDDDDGFPLPSAKKTLGRPPPNLYGPSSSSSANPSSANPSASGRSTSAKRELLSRAERKARDEALKLDASVYDYDGVYDGMKAAEAAVSEARKATAPTGPKYIDSFLAAAATRKLDRLRAEEKMLERERALEGDEFADKDKFVTEAYKKQMEEVRRAEEEEKARESTSYYEAGRGGIR